MDFVLRMQVWFSSSRHVLKNYVIFSTVNLRHAKIIGPNQSGSSFINYIFQLMFSSWLFCLRFRQPELVHIWEMSGLTMLTRLTWLTGLLPITLEPCPLRLLMVLIQVKVFIDIFVTFLSSVPYYCFFTSLYWYTCIVQHLALSELFVGEWNFLFLSLSTYELSGSGSVLSLLWLQGQLVVYNIFLFFLYLMRVCI